MSWEIKEYDSLELVYTISVPGNLTKNEINRTIKQLASRHLQPNEIVCANLRKRMIGKSNLLDVIDTNGLLQVGGNPFIVASKVEGQR